MLINRTNFNITSLSVVWINLVDVCLIGISKQKFKLEKEKAFSIKKWNKAAQSNRPSSSPSSPPPLPNRFSSPQKEPAEPLTCGPFPSSLFPLTGRPTCHCSSSHPHDLFSLLRHRSCRWFLGLNSL